MALQSSSSEIISAECGCLAGNGPIGCCKHIGALSSLEHQTCTDTLQQWNCPRAHKVEPVPVNQLGDRRRQLLPSKVRAKGSQMILYMILGHYIFGCQTLRLLKLFAATY